jgi:hypothetical protein
MGLKKRWKRAEEVEYDDTDGWIIFDEKGNKKKVNRWLAFARFIKGPKQKKGKKK